MRFRKDVRSPDAPWALRFWILDCGFWNLISHRNTQTLTDFFLYHTGIAEAQRVFIRQDYCDFGFPGNKDFFEESEFGPAINIQSRIKL
jgi:hypothetical protein